MRKSSKLDEFVERQDGEQYAAREAKPKIRREERGNIQVLTGVSSSIKSIPELLKAAGIPLAALDRVGESEFVVKRSKVNKYESIFGLRDGDKSTPMVVPLWQVWAELERRKALATEWAPIEPIEITLRQSPRPPKLSNGLAPGWFRTLVLPDSQHGYFRNRATGLLEPLHDRRACDIALQVAARTQPDRIILLGDMVDFSDWSEKFVQGPEFAFMARYAGLDLAWWIAQLRLACPRAAIDYIEGNHEARMPKMMMRNALQAYALTPVGDDAGPPLMSVERWLGLDKLGVTYHGEYPRGRVAINDNITAVHGHTARNQSGATTAAVVRDLQCSEIQGHIHRVEQAMRTVHSHRGASVYAAYSPGTLARIDGAVPAATPRVNWQQGLAEIIHEAGNGRFQVGLTLIHDGAAVHNGAPYIGQDYAERMAKDLGARGREFTEYWRAAA